MERNLHGIENGRRPMTTTFDKGAMESLQSKVDFLSDERNAPFLSSFFIDLIRRIRNTLGSIRNYSQLSRGKFSDKEFGEYFYRAVTEDIEKIDMVLNGLVNYIKLNTPIRKTDTVHHFIEEVLKKHQGKLEEKGIKLFKKFEKDLPETIVPDEQLRYILSSVFQYALGSISPNLSMGFYTRSFVLEKEGSQGLALLQKDGRYIEISVVFMGYKKPAEQGAGSQGLQKVVQRNRGIMRIEVDEQKAKTFISLRFPVERRRVVYYQSVN
jgi:hypothetical protein